MAPLAGCALRTSSGALFSGSSISTRTGSGTISPLQVALVSMSANGAQTDGVVSAVWAAVATGGGSPGAGHAGATVQLREQDEALLRAVAPDATFIVSPEVAPE